MANLLIHFPSGDRVQYDSAMLQAFELEDIIKCRSLRDYTARPQPRAKTWPWTQPLWTYKCVAKPHMTKVYSVLLGVLGCCIVWSEVVIPILVRGPGFGTYLYDQGLYIDIRVAF